MYKYWSQDDITFLKENVDILTNQELAEKFKTTIKAIESTLMRYEIMRTIQDKKWTKEEVEWIRQNIEKLSNQELADHFNVSIDSLKNILYSRKISRKKNILNFENGLLGEDEEFRDLECLNGKYKISNYGRIINSQNVLMNPFDSGGYLRITLSPHKGKKEKFFIHVLVALAFIPNPENKPFVNHKDFNKTNCYYKNLEWVTQSENEKHKFSNKPELKKHLSDIVSLKESKGKFETIERVKAICQEIVNDEKTIAQIAKDYDVSQKWVSSIKNKRIWKSISDEYFELV